jgi:hypothetical protein
MADPFDGRLIFPGGRKELKPFIKEMKKLRSNWVADTSWRYRKTLRLSAWKWADLADEVIDVLIAGDTETTMAFILGLAHAQDEAYTLALDATQIMHKYGAMFYAPGGEGSQDPKAFVNESQDFMSREVARQERLHSPPVSSQPAPDIERDEPTTKRSPVESEIRRALSVTEFTGAIYLITQAERGLTEDPFAKHMAKAADEGQLLPSHWVMTAHERLVVLTAKELEVSDSEAAKIVDRAYLSLKPPELDVHPLDWASESDDSEAVDTFFLVAAIQITPSKFEGDDPAAVERAPHVASAMIASTLKTSKDPTGAKRLRRLAELRESWDIDQEFFEGIEARIRRNALDRDPEGADPEASDSKSDAGDRESPEIAPESTNASVPSTSEDGIRDEEPPPTEEADLPVVEPTENAFCTACGREFQDVDRFCGTCGKPRQLEA